jgi:SAM-dependent methyltransferase
MKIGVIPETLFERLIVLLGLAPTPIFETFHAVIVARAIVVGTKLGVFGALAAAPLSAGDLAARLSLNVSGLEKLLNVLVSTRYLRFRAGQYDLSRVSRKWLLLESPQSLHDNMLLRLLEWEAIEGTENFVRTGKALDVHDLLRGNQWETYQRGMRSLARFSANEVARRVRLPTGAKTMLDIGGGHGTYSVAFCRHHPHLRATILDLGPAVETAAPILAEEEIGERVVHRVGDAITEDVGKDQWDLIFVSHLIHHFDEPANRDLVARAAGGLRPNGVLAILDVLRPATPNAMGQSGALLDLYFALTSNSGTWPSATITSWFRDAGLAPRASIALRTAPGLSVLTATKPGSGA